MSTRTISTAYGAGYTLGPGSTTLSITQTGYVGGTGVATGTIPGGAYTIANDGTVHAEGGNVGINLQDGGSIANDSAALIEGATGIWIAGAAGSVANLGTILGAGLAEYGMLVEAGGSITNGSAADTAALIEGRTGLWLEGGGTIGNFGTIDGTGASRYDLILGGAGAVTNGSATDRGALIEGWIGLGLYGGPATVTNFGTILGRHGRAIDFDSSEDVLVVEAGAVFGGVVIGDRGTLVLGSGGGAGTIDGLGNAASTYLGFGSFRWPPPPRGRSPASIWWLRATACSMPAR